MIAPLAVRLAVHRSGGRVSMLHEPTGSLGTATVVIPCYRDGRYLPGAVSAALDQPGLEMQVIVVDDASPDDSADIADDIAARDPRVTVIRHRVNKGHIATYNDGLDAADGEWVALVSADDLVTPRPSPCGRPMRGHPSVGLVYGRAEDFER